MAFTPPEARATFTPPEAQKFTPPEAQSDPSLGQVAAGVGTEVAAGIGGQLAGTAIGTAILPGVGTAVGYGVGSLTSGIGGSIAAQKIEGREDISWGRAIAAGLINLVPGGIGKGAKGTTTIAKAAGREAAKGAGFGATEATARAVIDEGRLPTMEELAQYGGAGAMFGGALGAGGSALGKKLSGKTIREVDDAIATGELKFDDLQPLAKGKNSTVLRNEFDKSRDALQEKLASEAIASKNLGTLGKVLASIAPSRFVGSKSQQAAIDYGRNVKTYEELGSRIARQVEKQTEKNPEIGPMVDKFLDTGEMSPELGGKLSSDLEQFAKLRKEAQQEMLGLLEDGSGAFSGMDSAQRAAMREVIQDSINDAPYTRREYKAFLDKNYTPPKGARDAAEREIAARIAQADGVDTASAMQKARKHLDDLMEKSAKSRSADPRTSGAGAVDSILRRRHNPGPAERAFLGEVREAPERIRGTLSGLGRSVARAKADSEILDGLVAQGIGSRTQSGDMMEVVLRGTGSEGTGVYVNPEVQTALNQIYLPSADRGTENIFLRGLQDMYGAGVGASKASKVLLNTVAYPVQLYGNTASLLGMGINPFRGAKRGAELALAEFGGIDGLVNNQEARQRMLKDITKMSKYGIKNSNVLESDIRNTLQDGIFSKALNKVTDPLGKLYSVPDTMGRYVGWKANQRMLRKVYPEASPEQVERMAADLINDTYQNYDKLSNTVRTLSRWGVMPQFASFTSEFMRNQYNQGKVIAQMLKGTYGDAAGLGRADLGAMRREGAKRLAALTAVYGATAGAVEGVKQLSGIDEDAEESLRDLAYAPWDKNRNVMVHLNEDGRTGWTANPSYISPHALGQSALQAGLRGDDEQSLVELLTEEFIGEGSFIAQEAFNALQNRQDSGKPITNELDALNSARDRLKFFITESFKPGFSRELEKFANAKFERGDQTLRDVGLRQMGLRSNPFDLSKAAMFTVRSNYEAAKGAKSQYSSAQRKDISPAEKAAAYESANRINRESFDRISKNNESMKERGFSEEERIQIMKDAGVSSAFILDILSSSYRNLPINKEPTTSEVYDDLPEGRAAKLKAIRDIRREDPKLAESLLRTMQRERKQSNLTEKEKLLKRMDSNERIRYIRSQPNPRGYARDLLRKRVISEEMFRTISQ